MKIQIATIFSDDWNQTNIYTDKTVEGLLKKLSNALLDSDDEGFKSASDVSGWLDDRLQMDGQDFIDFHELDTDSL